MIVSLYKSPFLTPILDCEKSTEYNCVSDQTWGSPVGWVWVCGTKSCPGYSTSSLNRSQMLSETTRLYHQRASTRSSHFIWTFWTSLGENGKIPFCDSAHLRLNERNYSRLLNWTPMGIIRNGVDLQTNMVVFKGLDFSFFLPWELLRAWFFI